MSRIISRSLISDDIIVINDYELFKIIFGGDVKTWFRKNIGGTLPIMNIVDMFDMLERAYTHDSLIESYSGRIILFIKDAITL